jgi:transcriptional regulator with XRE-family HTH domain
MARTTKAPSLPTTPGGWLACYRYRLKRRDGSPSSPEYLADRLAVSGDTVRRWEAGLARPSATDLLHFVEVCGLSNLERSFLIEAFAGVETEAPPDASLFRKHARYLLTEELPAYIFDSMFFVRAWNSYVDIVHNYPFAADGEHMLDRIFKDYGPDRMPDLGTRTREERGEWWLHTYWFHTARHCGSPVYTQTLNELGKLPQFAERWLALGINTNSVSTGPIGGPVFLNGARGVFRISTSTVLIPPAYYLREFVPIDERGWQLLSRTREQGPPEVYFASSNHWAECSGASPS